MSVTINHKIATSIDNECKLLVAKMAQCCDDLKNSHPEADIIILRSPERVVVQLGQIGMSLSWFKPRIGEDWNASIMIANWEGQVTFPGQTAMEGRHAKLISEEVLHLEPDEGSTWRWRGKQDDPPITTHALAERCIAEVATRIEV